MYIGTKCNMRAPHPIPAECGPFPSHRSVHPSLITRTRSPVTGPRPPVPVRASQHDTVNDANDIDASSGLIAK